MNHIRLPEELPGNRLRILTPKRQSGKSATVMGRMNAMIDGHQAWHYGLLEAVTEKRPNKRP